MEYILFAEMLNQYCSFTSRDNVTSRKESAAGGDSILLRGLVETNALHGVVEGTCK